MNCGKALAGVVKRVPATAEKDDLPIRYGATLIKAVPFAVASWNGGGEFYERRRKTHAGFNHRVIGALQIDLGKTCIVQLILAQDKRVVRILVRWSGRSYCYALGSQGDAASIVALNGICLQIAVENDPGALYRQRSGIASRYRACPTDAVSSADVDRLPAAEITPCP